MNYRSNSWRARAGSCNRRLRQSWNKASASQSTLQKPPAKLTDRAARLPEASLVVERVVLGAPTVRLFIPPLHLTLDADERSLVSPIHPEQRGFWVMGPAVTQCHVSGANYTAGFSLCQLRSNTIHFQFPKCPPICGVGFTLLATTGSKLPKYALDLAFKSWRNYRQGKKGFSSGFR